MMNEQDQRVPDSVRQKAKKLREDGADLLRELQKIGITDIAVNSIADLVEHVLPIIMKGSFEAVNIFTATLLQDADRQERLRIHTIIGNVLAEELKITPEEGKLAAYYLMSNRQRNDLAVNNQLPPPPPHELLKAVAYILLSVTLRYEQRQSGYTSSSDPYRERGKSHFVSVIEIYLLRSTGGQAGPVRKELTSELAFEDMLSAARETWIREGNKQPVIYKLFPRRAE